MAIKRERSKHGDDPLHGDLRTRARVTFQRDRGTALSDLRVRFRSATATATWSRRIIYYPKSSDRRHRLRVSLPCPLLAYLGARFSRESFPGTNLQASPAFSRLTRRGKPNSTAERPTYCSCGQSEILRRVECRNCHVKRTLMYHSAMHVSGEKRHCLCGGGGGGYSECVYVCVCPRYRFIKFYYGACLALRRNGLSKSREKISIQ